MFRITNKVAPLCLALIFTAGAHAVASGQAVLQNATVGPPPQLAPLIAHGKMTFQVVSRWTLASAEKMPEEKYSYKPAAEVRTYGQIVGHLADQNYRFCSLAKGEANPSGAAKIEQSKTTRAEVIAALKQSIAYCDAAYAGLTEANALEGVKLGPIDHPRIALLGVNVSHASLHYGNLVTYMRLNNIIPPSSELGGAAPPPKMNN